MPRFRLWRGFLCIVAVQVMMVVVLLIRSGHLKTTVGVHFSKEAGTSDALVRAYAVHAISLSLSLSLSLFIKQWFVQFSLFLCQLLVVSGAAKE